MIYGFNKRIIGSDDYVEGYHASKWHVVHVGQDDTDYQRQINLSKGLYFNLYHRLERSHKVQILAQLFPFDQETRFVFYDHHAFERLIREMGFKPYKKATTFYVPERYPINKLLRQQLGDVVNYIDFDIITYSGSHEILYFDQNHEIYKWHVTTNPIILVSNRPEVGHISFRDIQFDITNDQLKVYLDEVEANSEIPINRERISIIGIMSQFEQQTQARQGLFAILMVLGIVLLGLTILLLQVIVGLTYRINRIELATQKILGYQFLEMNQKLLVFLIIANVITMIFIVFLNGFFGLSILPQVILLSIVIQFIVFIFNAQKNYRESVVTTLKGEL